jgi:hypothetical protein
MLSTLIFQGIDIKFSFKFSLDQWRSRGRILELISRTWSRGPIPSLTTPWSGVPQIVGSAPHHAAPYIIQLAHEQGSSVNNMPWEGPDLLHAEMVGCPTTSLPSCTPTPGSTSSSASAPPPDRVQLQAQRCTFPLPLPLCAGFRLKIYINPKGMTLLVMNPSRSRPQFLSKSSSHEILVFPTYMMQICISVNFGNPN